MNLKPMTKVIQFKTMLVFLLLFSLSGCSGLSRKPVPLDQLDKAVIAGMPGVRSYWEKEIDPLFQKDLMKSIRAEPRGFYSHGSDGNPIYSGLAISGGGANGAFGAGILCGWSASGNRPTFKLVTGISTGALIAPYAFLGRAYDDKLKAAFTTVDTKDIMNKRGLSLFGRESLADTTPLAGRIARDVDEIMLADIAAAHARGQRLYIGTTNLDAQRFMVWNMGAIASSEHPGALSLFRQVMLASASIPVAFPPVYIEVEVDGESFDEMHVDGGTVTQVFFYEFMLDIEAAVRELFDRDLASENNGQVYVIRNSKIKPEPQHTRRTLVDIAARSIDTMIKSASYNDLVRIYQFTHDDKIEFNYIGVPDDFEFESDEMFDPEEMNALFDLGYQMALEDGFWLKAPL